MIRKSRSLGFAAVAVAAGLSLAACGTTNDSNSSSSSGKSCDATFAFLGPTTGPYAALGINIIDGAKVAQKDFEKANPDCKFDVKTFDSQGDPDKAKNLAVQIVNDQNIIGVIGPTFSGESDSTGKAFNEAGLVTVSASATNPALTTNGWTTFHRILGNDNIQGPPGADYIKNELHAKNVFVVDDASEYGKGLADIVKQKLGSLVKGTDEVQQGQTDFSATVTKVKADNPDVLYYGGYYPEAGLFIKQLRDGGWNGQFVSGDGTKDPAFVQAAGTKAAAGTILTCPCGPSTGKFLSEYKAINGQDPGTYSPEGYDVMNIFMQGVKAGNTDRSKMLDWVNNYDQDGLTKHIKFTSTGEVTETPIFAFKVTPAGDIVGIKQIN